MRIRDWLLIIGAMIVGLVGGMCLVANSAEATEIRFENCEPGTWVGGVKWEWKDGIRGNYMGSKYHDVPELELKGTGAIVVDLEPGDYAITHYRPKTMGQLEDGRYFVRPSAVLNFVEIEVTEEKATYYFGCE